jgi:hypothetical protein
MSPPICTIRARCEKHGRDLHGWPCPDCIDEWRAAHPATSAAIARIASGKSANLSAARRADADSSEAPRMSSARHRDEGSDATS